MKDVKKKILCKTELRWGRNGWSKSGIQCNSTQKHTKFIYFWAEKNHQSFGTVLSLAVFCTPKGMSWPLSHVPQFCNMAKEQNLEVELLDATQDWKNLSVWLKKSKWDIVSKCEKDAMTCPLYHRGVSFKRNSEVVADHIGPLWRLRG
jgi:hypothetical protein